MEQGRNGGNHAAQIGSHRGPGRSRKMLIESGQTLKIGRTEQADLAFPEDMMLSRLHFAIECAGDGLPDPRSRQHQWHAPQWPSSGDFESAQKRRRDPGWPDDVSSPNRGNGHEWGDHQRRRPRARPLSRHRHPRDTDKRPSWSNPPPRPRDKRRQSPLASRSIANSSTRYLPPHRELRPSPHGYRSPFRDRRAFPGPACFHQTGSSLRPCSGRTSKALQN